MDNDRKFIDSLGVSEATRVHGGGFQIIGETCYWFVSDTEDSAMFHAMSLSKARQFAEVLTRQLDEVENGPVGDES